jgi:hypothetical protein
MKTRTTFTIALATAAALGLGASAQAQQGTYDPDYGQPPDAGYQQGYPQGNQAPYDNGYAGPRSYRQLLIAAQEMDDAANYAYRQFERNNRRPNPDEAQVSARLEELAQNARHFHREVASYRGDPRHKQDDFQRLVQAYERAADATRYISARPYVDRGMERIGLRIDQTASIYGMNLAEMNRYRGERRYNRGRDDRYRRDDTYRGYDNGYRQNRDGDVYVPTPPPAPYR